MPLLPGISSASWATHSPAVISLLGTLALETDVVNKIWAAVCILILLCMHALQALDDSAMMGTKVLLLLGSVNKVGPSVQIHMYTHNHQSYDISFLIYIC